MVGAQTVMSAPASHRTEQDHQKQGSGKQTSNQPWLAIDLGATSGRALLGRLNGGKLVIEEIHRFPHGPVPVGGTLYWDALYLWSGILSAMRTCARRGIDRLAGIGVTTWGIDFCLLDAEGRMLENPVCYRDARTEGMEALIARAVPEREFFQTTGMRISRLGSLPQLLSLARDRSEILGRARTLLFMPDLFRSFLCGERSTEPTIAGSSLLTDARRRSWSDLILSAFRLDPGLLARLGPAGEVVGGLSSWLAPETGIRSAPVIAVAGHDTLSAASAAPRAGPRTLFLSTGTWSVLGLLLDEPVTTDASFEQGFLNELGVEGIAFVKNLMGFFLLEELRARWGDPPHEELSVAAKAAPPFAGILDLEDPAFFAPEDPERVVAEYLARTGQARSLSRGELVRAQLEGLALLYRRTIEELRQATGMRPDGISMVGGGCRNELFCQLVADATCLPVAAGPAEATAVGNLGLQCVATGELAAAKEVRELAARSFPPASYQPTVQTGWDAAYERFQDIVRRRTQHH